MADLQKVRRRGHPTSLSDRGRRRSVLYESQRGRAADRSVDFSVTAARPWDLTRQRRRLRLRGSALRSRRHLYLHTNQESDLLTPESLKWKKGPREPCRMWDEEQSLVANLSGDLGGIRQ